MSTPTYQEAFRILSPLWDSNGRVQTEPGALALCNISGYPICLILSQSGRAKLMLDNGVVFSEASPEACLENLTALFLADGDEYPKELKHKISLCLRLLQSFRKKRKPIASGAYTRRSR